MALRVAPCPRCKAALVFGEVACRTCGQTFQYGATPPPQPTFAQIIEALQAAGMPLPPGAVPTPPTRSQQPPNPFDAGIESGRFRTPEHVEIQEVPGLMDSTLFKAFTPAHVDAQPIFGLETGRHAEIGDVAPAFTPGLEATAGPATGDVFTQPVSGLFHSDIFRAPGEVDRLPIDGFEPSPSATRPPAKSSSSSSSSGEGGAVKPAGKKKVELGRATCSCGEVHKEPRCPACGRPHRDLP